ncbi:peptidylprolyl isomerase [Nocardia terpenica]|uniref:peptidylprolyl isomerase n=1 Tax=Nocardia terpenica TaxID=455432 RepID=UPI001893AC90|nr:peptidylprolyl isomerase [Nocardia terpenica]MBF6065871.1 peptidylprolyl isomerase [Nocardia terpenica]MBF6108366.1 peptidylprolyl isomerase [Nocardia terpenica]MBF6115986.1 peptidylprolyl isomerase [Nocardia terpenica]MBF6123116.1 peptidylprolyl isomerase [Nocardia terpenica]MBF6156210.1 peptidylprolyl isomerase [Nocardia terpenica]
MKSRWGAALAVAIVSMSGLITGANPAAAAPAPVTWCSFTPTPENPAARPVLAPPPIAPTLGTIDVTLRFDYGPVTLRLDRAGAAPCAVQNMTSLVLQHFYDQSRCWRLTDSARLGVLQCGDIYEVEKGGPGYRFPDEVDGTETYERGTIAMGNQGPGTNGSEFFIVHSYAHIPAAYSVLGRVVSGMDVLDRMVAAGITPTERGPRDGLPTQPVTIEDAHLAV